jgi:hypothetical protein
VNIKQAGRLLLILSLVSAVLYISLVRLNNLNIAVEEILSVGLAVIAILFTLSTVMFNYLDSIAKDITELRDEVTREKYICVQESITKLKREVLSNLALIIFLLFAEKLIKGLTQVLAGWIQMRWISDPANAILSIRGAMFVVAIWAATIQFKGFLVAAEYRVIIAKNRQ